MNLREWLKAEWGRSAGMAKALGVSPVRVTQWGKGDKPIPRELLIKVSSFTGGDVSLHELDPEVYPDPSWKAPGVKKKMKCR